MTRVVGSPREGVSLWLRAVSHCRFLLGDLAREDRSLTVTPHAPPLRPSGAASQPNDLFSPTRQQALRRQVDWAVSRGDELPVTGGVPVPAPSGGVGQN